MVLIYQKAISRVAGMGSSVWHPRGRRARHASKVDRRTWEILTVLPGKGVSMNKCNSEDIETAVRKSDGA
jgi:hypothetical protein